MKRILAVLILLFALPAFAVNYNEFDINDVNAIHKATRAYQQEFYNKRGSQEAVNDYLEFLVFYQKAVAYQSSQITFDYKSHNNSFEQQAQIYSNDFFYFLMIVQFDEGEFFLVKSNHYLYNEFASYLTEDWQELLKFETYFDKRIISDTKYIIPKYELKRIIAFYKNFNKKYPDFICKDSIKQKITVYQADLKHYPNVIY